jgi:geranylgeranyl pyrophosphate synthase
MFGNAASVLVGDFLYSRAFQMMVGVESMRVMQVLADATNIIAEGEVLQLLNCHNADVEVDDYLQVIRYKTAKLFEAATRLGGILAGASPEVEEGWRPSACTSEPPSSSSMTCSTIRAKRPTPASTSATIWPKASPRCR